MTQVDQASERFKQVVQRQQEEMKKKNKPLSERVVVSAKESKQLSLFSLLPEYHPEEYSKLFSFYDSIPRFFWGRARRTKEGFLPVLKRKFKDREGNSYNLRISPSFIEDRKQKDENGEYVSKSVYPGIREEIIESVLIKLAVDGTAAYIDDNAGVIASLYAIRKELKERGHSYSLQEIKDALSVLNGSIISLEPEDKDSGIEITEFSIISGYSISRAKKGSSSNTYIVFNPLITDGLKKRSHRLYNYGISMNIKDPLARWIFKRMSLFFKQASPIHHYTIKASTIIESSGIQVYKDFRKTLAVIRKSLDALVETKTSDDKHKVIWKWEESTVYDAQKSNKIVDAIFTLHASMDFIKDTKKANLIESNVKEGISSSENLKRVKKLK